MKLAWLPALAIASGLFANINPVSAQIGTVWQQTSLPNEPWTSVASSADGTKLVVGQFGGLVYISANSGATWTPTTVWGYVQNNGHAIASSADGTKLAVASIDSQIYISRDSGANWTACATTQNWSSVASSADGTKLVAAVNYGQIYTSTDSGTNWTVRATTQGWTDVASSADGTKLVAVMGGIYGPTGQIYTSVDSGTNWTARGPTQYWSSVASSADGTKLVATDVFDTSLNFGIGYLGEIYTSGDSGTNWSAPNQWTASAQNWISVASSTNGNNLVAVAMSNVGVGYEVPSPGVVYTSADSGATWQRAYAPDSAWSSVASSADGTKLVASVGEAQIAEISGGVYTYAAPSTNSPTLGIGTTVTWPWPSAGYVLQQNTNPASPNWLTLSNTSVVVVNQVTVAPTNSQNFYRLAKP